MKKTVMIICIFLCVLLLALSIYPYSRNTLKGTLKDYSQIIMDIPEDVHLKIYYIDPHILTRIPLSVEKLMVFPGMKAITIESEELAKHSTLLRKLDASIISAVNEESYIDARLYYAFETGNGNKFLEVIVNEINGPVFVNGYEVENNPIFYEIIVPFLSEEDRIILGI